MSAELESIGRDVLANLNRVPLGRGEPGMLRLQGRLVEGHWLSASSQMDMRRVVRGLLEATMPRHSSDQRVAVLTLYEDFGLGESCYGVDKRVFSVRQQVGGPALGYIQVEPQTALSVIAEAFGSPACRMVRSGVRKALCCDLAELLRRIRAEPEAVLQDHGVGALVLRLKLGNRGFADFGSGWQIGACPTIEERARIWKRVWNTARGAGTVEGWLAKVRSYRVMVDGWR